MTQSFVHHVIYARKIDRAREAKSSPVFWNKKSAQSSLKENSW